MARRGRIAPWTSRVHRSPGLISALPTSSPGLNLDLALCDTSCGRERERLRALSLRICSFGWDGDFGARRRHANSTDHGSGSFLLEGSNTCFRASERWARGSDIEHGWTVAVESFLLAWALWAGPPTPDPPRRKYSRPNLACRKLLRRQGLGSEHHDRNWAVAS
jgi:hypothetical protein